MIFDQPCAFDDSLMLLDIIHNLEGRKMIWNCGGKSFYIPVGDNRRLVVTSLRTITRPNYILMGYNAELFVDKSFRIFGFFKLNMDYENNKYTVTPSDDMQLTLFTSLEEAEYHLMLIRLMI